MFCKYCGKEVLEDASFCKYCGGDLSVDEKDIKTNKNGIISLILGVIGLVAWIVPIIGFLIQVPGLFFGVKGLLDSRKKKISSVMGIIFCIIGLMLNIINVSIEDEEISIQKNNNEQEEAAEESEVENNQGYNYEDHSLLTELETGIQPVGIFLEPSLFYKEEVDFWEWISYIEYNQDIFKDSHEDYLQVRSAVVKIVCEDEKNYYYGSGTNFNKEGYVITNLHVIEGRDDLSCLVGFPDPESGLVREAYWAVPIMSKEAEPEHDLVVLSLENPVFDEEYNIYGFYERFIDGSFPYYKESDECLEKYPQLGERIIVLGYPLLSGGALTITDGVISSLYSFDNYIVTSAKIGGGNSGGLAINENNCFVGIPVAVYLEENNERYGEIIDAPYVYDFYSSMKDTIIEYYSE